MASQTACEVAEETYEWPLSDKLGDSDELDRNVSQMKEFVSAYQSGSEMPIGIEDAVKTYDIASSIKLSAKEGRRICIINQSDRTLREEPK